MSSYSELNPDYKPMDPGKLSDIREAFRRTLDDLRHATATPTEHVCMEEKLSRAGMIVAHPDDVPNLRELIRTSGHLFPNMGGPRRREGARAARAGPVLLHRHRRPRAAVRHLLRLAIQHTHRRMSTNATFDYSERHATVLALAVLSLQRPGWLDYLGRIAEERFDGRELFDDFRKLQLDKAAVDGEPIEIETDAPVPPSDQPKTGGRCKACGRLAPLVDGECPDCRH